jgi:hypothetical protein
MFLCEYLSEIWGVKICPKRLRPKWRFIKSIPRPQVHPLQRHHPRHHLLRCRHRRHPRHRRRHRQIPGKTIHEFFFIKIYLHDIARSPHFDRKVLLQTSI